MVCLTKKCFKSYSYFIRHALEMGAVNLCCELVCIQAPVNCLDTLKSGKLWFCIQSAVQFLFLDLFSLRSRNTNARDLKKKRVWFEQIVYELSHQDSQNYENVPKLKPNTVYFNKRTNGRTYFCMSLFLPQVLLEPCGSSGAECWRNPDSQWPSPYQTCGMCAAPPLELDPNNCTRSIFNNLCTNKITAFDRNDWFVHTSSLKTRLEKTLSLASKKTVPSRPNFGMRTMIAFFLTNRTNPSSFSIPRVLKNN